MAIINAIEIDEELYSLDEIRMLSYNEVYQLLGAIDCSKTCKLIVNIWNKANPNSLKELEIYYD